ncbi:MAG: hypothetical protein R3F59_34585 [Myxococcota bacterium]
MNRSIGSGAPVRGWRLAVDAVGVLVTGALLGAILDLVLAPRLGPVRLGLLIDAGTFALAAGSLALVVGTVDRLSLGHAAFVAVGAYVAAVIGYYVHVIALGSAAHLGGELGPTAGIGALGALAGALVAGAMAVPVGVVSVRSHPAVLPVVTLLLDLALVRGLRATHDVLADPGTIRTASVHTLATSLGGPVGFTSAPFTTTLLWVCIGLAMLFAAASVVTRRPPPTSLAGRTAVFAVGCALAGLAGGMMALHVGFVQRPATFGLATSVELLAAALALGWGSVTGATVAGVALVLALEVPPIAAHPTVVFGAVALAAIALRVRGHLPTWEPWRRAG